ncbi:hypothetical protein BHE74_00013204 [Ensete ventricosum]|nr:hypothetical protein BHE74_00013204 [Ensete ventricosum]
MRPASKFAEQALAGSGPCALARPPRNLLGTEWELVWMSGDSELDLGGRLLEWWSPGEEGVVQLWSAAGSCKKVGSGAFIVSAVDHSYLITLLPLWLTIPLSAVRALAPPVYPAGYLRRVGHVGRPAVRECDDLAARSAFVISFFPPGKTFSRRPILAERVTLGANSEILAERVTSGSNSEISAERVNSGAKLKEGLKRMGRVTYEYGYRVALARFRARYPDADIEEDPFTIYPEDDLVPMERQQDFDDSAPPES